MYLKNDGYSGYDRNGEQIRQRGLFLCLIQVKGTAAGRNEVKAIVRKVALRQFGPWMMGKVRIYNESYTVSGAYGSDGLPMGVSPSTYDRAAVVLPGELYDAWSKGGGHNSAGSEATAIREWALANLEALTN